MIKRKNFCYREQITTYTKDTPDCLKFSETISDEVLVLRLLLGTIAIDGTINSKSFTINQSKNYFQLENVQNNPRVSNTTIKNFLNYYSLDSDQLKNYISKNRKNYKLYNNILLELSMYFYYKNKEDHLSSFIFIYRTLEHLSYSFPLIYASKSGNYEKSFEELKKFFSGDNAQGELKFFNRFMINLFDEDTQKIKIDLEMAQPYSDKGKKLNSLICNQGGITSEVDGMKLKIEYKNSINFIVSLRNRFFHNLLGSDKNNILMSEYSEVIEPYFETFNDKFLNWISVIIIETVCHNVNSN